MVILVENVGESQSAVAGVYLDLRGARNTDLGVCALLAKPREQWQVLRERAELRKGTLGDRLKLSDCTRVEALAKESEMDQRGR